MLTITDEASRRVWVLFGARRDLDRLFTEWKNTVELETGLKVKVVRCDNAAEFRALGARMAPYGLQFEYTSFYSAWQNGVPERLNRTLITVSRAMILGTKLPLKFWQDAAETACYIRNRTPVGPEGKTPIEIYSGKKPDIGHLRSWGCLAYARVPKETRANKLEPTAVQTIFIGYRPTTKQYRLYEPRSGTVINATEPEFHEDKLLQWDWGEKVTGDLVLPWDPWETVQTPVIIGPEEEPGDTIVVDVPEEGAYLTSESTILVPRNWEEAMDDPVHRPYWQEAIGIEVSKLQGFCDADYAGDTDDRASCSGGLWLLNSGAVVWASTKQRSIALSTGESEYIAAAEAAKTGQWLRGLLEEIQRTEYLGEHLSVPIFSDNTACITLAKDPVAHSRTKHIEVRYHYIRQLVAYGKTTLAYLPTEDMLADILTKPLPNTAFQRCIRGLLGP